MPQITAEKKFFPVRADKFFHNIAPVLSKSTATVDFQQYKGFLKNVAGGEA